MDIEQALRIIDPDTTKEALEEIEYYAGFKGHDAIIDAVDEACRVVCEYVRKQMKGREDGVVIDLPCAIGADAYRVHDRCKSPAECPYNGGWGTSRCSNARDTCGPYVEKIKLGWEHVPLLGDCVFATEKEANRKWKKLMNQRCKIIK